jgi:hypothetical protein
MKEEGDPEDTRTAPHGPKEDLGISQETPRSAQGLPRRPQEAPEGPRRFEELPGEHPAKNRKI